jgi:hypothetical protein
MGDCKLIHYQLPPGSGLPLGYKGATDAFMAA